MVPKGTPGGAVRVTEVRSTGFSLAALKVRKVGLPVVVTVGGVISSCAHAGRGP